MMVRALRLFALALSLALMSLPGGEAAAQIAQSLPPGSLVEREVAYGPEPEQRMDLYLPPGPRRAPILMMVHGGAWAVGDKSATDVVRNKAMRWLARGYILVSATYRLLPKAGPLEQARDVARALAALQERAVSYGGDPSRIVLFGHSAGAHLVALLTADPGLARDLGARPWLGTVALDSAAYDVPTIMAERHLRFYDRAFGKDASYWRSASPVHRLTGDALPMLLVCSDRPPASCSRARRFARRAALLKVRAEVLPVPLRHSEINGDLGLPGPYTEAVESFLDSIGLHRQASKLE